MTKFVKPTLPLDFVEANMIEVSLECFANVPRKKENMEPIIALIETVWDATRYKFEAMANGGQVPKKLDKKIVNVLLKQLEALRQLEVLK